MRARGHPGRGGFEVVAQGLEPRRWWRAPPPPLWVRGSPVEPDGAPEDPVEAALEIRICPGLAVPHLLVHGLPELSEGPVMLLLEESPACHLQVEGPSDPNHGRQAGRPAGQSEARHA